MRELQSHKIDGYNGFKPVTVADNKGNGGANHVYHAFHGPDTKQFTPIVFQDGGIDRVGHNGLTSEQLLAITIDRMEGFQSGNFATENNRLALEYMKKVLGCLQARTKERIERGVEGKEIK